MRFGEQRKQRVKEKLNKKREVFKSQFNGYYTPTQVANLLNISMNKAYRLNTIHGIPVKHFGKFVAYSVTDIDKLKSKMQDRGTWTPKLVAKSLGIKDYDVWNAIKSGKISAKKIANRIFITEEEYHKLSKIIKQ